MLFWSCLLVIHKIQKNKGCQIPQISIEGLILYVNKTENCILKKR